ncbi:hypothetical protein EOD41_05270 [Mucilaginibacter limnophilus]|uniref:Uncharacterized protein n=1 Tax=Mucilaginibacter limnophilus TaxID=1932778 RepID=A0A3S2UMK1_9SPHI|nr:hypothetical protein [Mucilaginibacter limnophilus]RVU01376.1 hypothetical protein EOD41_05270 [Mucilaginibacter limnophilus]
MKALIKYLSLLLCSGLIIPFYYYHIPGKSSFDTDIKKTVRQYKSAKKRFSLIEDIGANLFPVIKKLN